MPVGFARSLFGGSATSTAANWSAYTGANDVEYTISDCSGIIGFKEFDSTRGILVTYQAVGGNPGYDLVHVRLVTLDPSANTLTFGTKISHGIANQADFESKAGTLQKTSDGAIVLITNDQDGTCRTYYLSNGVLTQSNKMTTSGFSANDRGSIRRSDNTFFQLRGNSYRQISVTNAATSTPSQSELESKTFSASGILSSRSVPGFDGDDVVLFWLDTGTDTVACKRHDLTAATPISSTNVSGLGNSSTNLETSDMDNYVDVRQGNGMNAGFETTAFNDTAILIERGYPSTAPADDTWRFHTYKAGDSVYKVCTVISDGIGKTDPAGYAFLGSTNANCFFMATPLTTTVPDRYSSYFLVDLNLTNNTARVVKTELLNYELDPSFLAGVYRFGNDRGLHTYATNKLKLMVP